MTEVTRKQAEKLLQLARQTIRERLTAEKAAVEDDHSDFDYRAATFVTLKIGGQLRGCIGNLEPVGSLWESVGRNALNAAFHDARFSPVTESELEKIHIDISILGESKPLYYEDGDDLERKLCPGKDGVILRHGRSGATFLPQVWDQLPTVDLFMGHLCRKAGLEPDCWRTDHPEIRIYRVRSFGEEKR